MTSATARLGAYRLEGVIGHGGMGTVYRAVDERLGRVVALKVIRLNSNGAAHISPEALRREARLVARLSHPNVVTIFAYEEAGGSALIAMEFAAGQPLTARLGTPWPVMAAASVLLGVARGVGAAHAAGIVHLDLKPANIMVTDAGVAKVLDFGIAQTLRSIHGKGHSSIGTLGYMAPEQFQSGPVGPWTDVFALGVLGYEMLTGRRAFVGANASEIAERTVTRHPPGFESESEARRVGGVFGVALWRAVHKNPGARQRDAEEFARAVAAAGSGRSWAGWRMSRPIMARPSKFGPTGVRKLGPQALLMLGTGAALGLLLLAAGLNTPRLGLVRTAGGGGGGGGVAVAALPSPPLAPVSPVLPVPHMHGVEMVLNGGEYLNLPAQLTVKSGDLVVFHNVSGGPHNVNFWADGIPLGVQDQLNWNMPDRMGSLSGPLLVGQNESYAISFADVPPGDYLYYCLPHLAMGQVGMITVAP